MTTYAFPPAGLPDQNTRPDEKAVFTNAYAFIPANTMRDIVTSNLPHWSKTRTWIIARPMSGFAETFAQYAVEVAAGGGSASPEPDPMGEAGILVCRGQMMLTVDGEVHTLNAGGYAFIPHTANWQVENTSAQVLQFHWIRKRYQPVNGIDAPALVLTSDDATDLNLMVNAEKWGTKRFVDPNDLRHDMHVNIVHFEPGGVIPFAETHVMEHGLYVLQGTAKYLLNQDWVDVGPGDFMWLRAFCPQACIATGDEPFRYLLYKDVNRHVRLGINE